MIFPIDYYHYYSKNLKLEMNFEYKIVNVPTQLESGYITLYNSVISSAKDELHLSVF